MLQPLGIAYIAFAPGDVLDRSCVDQIDLQAIVQQDGVQVVPVNPRGLHGHGPNAQGAEPLGQSVQIGGKALEDPDLGGAFFGHGHIVVPRGNIYPRCHRI